MNFSRRKDGNLAAVRHLPVVFPYCVSDLKLPYPDRHGKRRTVGNLLHFSHASLLFFPLLCGILTGASFSAEGS